MICPNCQAIVTLGNTVRRLAICPACLRTLALDDEGAVRLATADDTVPLTDGELGELRRLRKKARDAQPIAEA